MPSEAFPEVATRNRSAAARLSGEVTAMPPALLGERTLEAISRSTFCNVVKAGLLQSTKSNFTGGSCIIDCLIVTQFQGNQTNWFSRYGCKVTQPDQRRGWNSPNQRVLT